MEYISSHTDVVKTIVSQWIYYINLCQNIEQWEFEPR